MLWRFMNILNMLDCLHDCHNLSTTGLEFVLQHATNIIKINLHMKKVIEVSAFNPNSTRSWPNVSTLFFRITKLIIINTHVFK